MIKLMAPGEASKSWRGPFSRLSFNKSFAFTEKAIEPPLPTARWQRRQHRFVDCRSRRARAVPNPFSTTTTTTRGLPFAPSDACVRRRIRIFISSAAAAAAASSSVTDALLPRRRHQSALATGRALYERESAREERRDSSSSVENAVAPPRPAAEVAGVTESTNGAEVVTASDLIAFMNATSEMQKPAHIGGVSQVTSQTGASESRKPHTNLAEVDPNAFVQTLSHRLEKVRESRGKMEKLLSRMQPTDAAAESTELDPEFSAEKQQQQQPSQQFEGKDLAVNLPLRSFSRETGGRRRASSSSRFLMTSRVPSAAVNSACLRKKLSALVCDDVDDAQVILEDHCSRIWTDEAGEEDLLQLNQSSTEPATAICPPASLAQRKTHHHQRFNPSSHHADVYSISSFDSGVVTCGGLNSSDSESCISRCQNQGTHNRGIYPAGGATAGKYASSSAHHKHCFKLPPSTAAPPPASEDCFGASGPGWNPALPPPPACFFCQRPSMNSTPSVHRKAPAYQACWAAGAYPAPPPIYPSQYPDGLQSSRTMRSRSLTSDSPSVFDSGLSSTYDQLPVARRPRQDEQDQRSTEAFNSLGTPMPTHVTRMGPPKEVPDPARLHDQSFRSAIEKPVGNDCGPPVSCPINPAGPHPSQFPPNDDNNLPHRLEHKTKATVCGGGQKTLETSSVKPTSSGIGPVGLVVGYYLCDDPVPYRTVWTGSIPPQTSTDGGGDQQSSTDATASATDSTCVGTSGSDSGHPASITLGQFKQLVAKKGVYRYFFKTASDEFGTGVVHEEIGDDNAYLPLWEGKAPREDGIPAEIFKSCVDTLAPWFHEVIERECEDEVVPDDWGLGILVPILKKGDKTRCENYRGISLIDVAAKIFAIVLLRVFQAVRDSRVRPNQASLRAGLECTDQILALRRILEFRHDYQQPTAVCFIDFAAAFDSVHRESLWRIMALDGVPAKIIAVIKAYYLFTIARVLVRNNLTHLFGIRSGVRQGCILSPLMFNYAID
nr:unnamed protein product [Spirometra erinaceieuropaei]